MDRTIKKRIFENKIDRIWKELAHGSNVFGK